MRLKILYSSDSKGSSVILKTTISNSTTIPERDALEKRTRRVGNTRYLSGLMNQIVPSRVSSPHGGPHVALVPRLLPSPRFLSPSASSHLPPRCASCISLPYHIHHPGTLSSVSPASLTRMATAAPLPRNPLATRPQQHNTGMSISPCRSTLKKTSVALKRPLSPEPADTPTDHSSKRVKTTPSAPVVQESPTPAAAARMEARKDKDRRREKERVQREEEFKVKYSRAFPSWVFYFDLDSGNPETASIRNHLEKRVGFMGAVSCMSFSFRTII